MAHAVILDIGKTNKKCLVFDQDYQCVFEQSTRLPEVTDEDGFPCEDSTLLQAWILESLQAVSKDTRFQIRAVNVTTYGASFAHLGENNELLTSICNYLKPFSEELKKQFFDKYGGETKIALETASPVLGNLNSGLQLYALKYHSPEVYRQIKWSLHLPQFVARLAGKVISTLEDTSEYPEDTFCTEMTSIGCHTMLWDFVQNDYHDWVKSEGLLAKFPPFPNGQEMPLKPTRQIYMGAGLHDSSAALIPYLASFDEPFLLLSTGTWCISLNPFNHEPLTAEELSQDCLCYMSFQGKPVKAARFFGGYEHEQAVNAIAQQHGLAEDFYRQGTHSVAAQTAYAQFMRDFMGKQVASVHLALGKSPVRRIFVDGGFAQNQTFMTLLAQAFPDKEIYAAVIAQATALGAALAMHDFWNEKSLPGNLISLQRV